MGNPDNVGGLPVFVSSDIERLLSDAYACGMNGDPFDMLNARRVIDKSVHAYAELCRAAPAGGDPERGKIDPSWSLFDRVDFSLRDAGFDLDEAANIAALAAGSAPAGSGEVEDIAASLEQMTKFVWCLHEETMPDDCVQVLNQAAALLRKLQQGAE